MRTTRYTVEIDYLETDMLQRMDITKKEYKRQLDFLRMQVRATVDNECPVEESVEVQDREGYTKTVSVYRCGCCTTYLTAIECHPGYMIA